jgi:hypothetical protein
MLVGGLSCREQIHHTEPPIQLAQYPDAALAEQKLGGIHFLPQVWGGAGVLAGAMVLVRRPDGTIVDTVRPPVSETVTGYKLGPYQAGRYRLHLEYIGAQPTSADVDIRAGMTDTLRLAIEYEPIC